MARQIVRVSGGVMAAQVLSKTDPVYPPIAKAARVTGAVEMQALIGRTGSVGRLMVISGPEMLQAAALEAVRHWNYRPYLLEGKPVEVETTVTVNFSLGGAPPAAGSFHSGGLLNGVMPAVQTAGHGAELKSPIRISSEVMLRQMRTKLNPTYPTPAKAKGVSGVVSLHATIGKDGRVKDLQVESGPRMLQAATIEAVRHWEYKPYTLIGELKEVETVISILYGFVPEDIWRLSDRATRGSKNIGVGNGSQGIAAYVYTDGLESRGPVRVSSARIAKSLASYIEPVTPVGSNPGIVKLAMVLGKDGAVEKVQPLSGEVNLRQAAVEAVRQWMYKPYLVNGEPVKVETVVTVRFALGSGRPPAA